MNKTTKNRPFEKLLEKALVSEEDQPYDIPKNWMWTKCGAVSQVIRGVSYKKNQVENEKIINNCLIIRGGNIQDGEILNQSDNVYVNKNIVKDNQFLIENDIVLVSSTGSSKVIGKAASVTSNFVNESFGAFITLVRPNDQINGKFLGYYFQSSRYRKVISDLAKGSNINNIKADYLQNLRFPLPPFSEQNRIIEKIEYLFNKLEEAKQVIEKVKREFELRKIAILDKAFRGELTRKWRQNNTNIESLKKALSNINQLKSQSRIKSNTNQIKSITKEEEPFSIPETWNWVRLGEIAYYITSGSRDWSKYYSDTGAKFIRTQDINTNKLDLRNVAYMKLPDNVEGKRSLVEKNDILTTITGANVGKCALVEADIDEAYVSQSVALTKMVDKSMSKYIHLSLISPSGGGKELEERAYGIGRPVLSLEDIKNIKIPLAPLEEQQQIIKIVSTLIENEETALKKLEIDIEQIRLSILDKAFKGELGTNDPSEESAMELLKEVLKSR